MSNDGRTFDPPEPDSIIVRTEAWLAEAKEMTVAIRDDDGEIQVASIVSIPVEEPGWYIIAKRPDGPEASGDADDTGRRDDAQGDVPPG